MAYAKLYTRINWINKVVAKTTPLGATNLNNMDYTINELDNRTVELDTKKAEQSTVLDMVSSWTMDEETGIITVTKLNGEQILFDLNIEKIPVNFTMSEEGVITMTTDDGTEFTADISKMIPVLTFESSDTILVSTSGEGINKTYSFEIKDGSVTEDKLQPNFLAEIKVQASSAETSALEAAYSADAAKKSETNAAASEAAAAKSESNASASETNAKTSETNAETSETNAKTSETNSAASETAAATSASAAAASASTASSAATAASNSATSAANSASTATSKASAAATSATNASTSETNAAASAEEAAQIVKDLEAAGTVNGVRGSAESEYRTGLVELTAENVGALPVDGTAVAAKTATKATQDGSGNAITDTYATKKEVENLTAGDVDALPLLIEEETEVSGLAELILAMAGLTINTPVQGDYVTEEAHMSENEKYKNYLASAYAVNMAYIRADNTPEIVDAGAFSNDSVILQNFKGMHNYLLATQEQNRSTGVVYGYRVIFIAAPYDGTLGTVALTYKNIITSTNAGVTVTYNSDSTVTLKVSSETYRCKYTLIKL